MACLRMGDELAPAPLTLERLLVEFPDYTDQGMAVATMVFYTAAHYNTVFSRPHPMILRTWAHMYSTFAPWLTVALADAAVHQHFAACVDGDMRPAHVIVTAKRIAGIGDA